VFCRGGPDYSQLISLLETPKRLEPSYHFLDDRECDQEHLSSAVVCDRQTGMNFLL